MLPAKENTLLEKSERNDAAETPKLPVRPNCGSVFAAAAPICALACCSRAPARPLPYDLRRHHQRNIERQLHRSEIESPFVVFARRLAEIDGKLAARGRKLLRERRQRGLHRRQIRLRRQNIGTGGTTQFELLPAEIDLMLRRCNELMRRINLRAQRRFEHGRRHDIRGKGLVGGLQFLALRIAPGFLRLDTAPHAAKNVEVV